MGKTRYVLYKMFNSSSKDKIFELNNRGNHLRDFTYIGVNLIFQKLIVKKFKKN